MVMMMIIVIVINVISPEVSSSMRFIFPLRPYTFSFSD